LKICFYIGGNNLIPIFGLFPCNFFHGCDESHHHLIFYHQTKNVMRKLLVCILLLPLFSYAQNNSVINVSRYFPKSDKVQQFEKALAAHAQKYHKGDAKWRVYTVETGPDAGGYHVIEGPTTWDAADKRGDLGKAHMDDWFASVQPLLSDRVSTSYLVFRKDLSTVQLTDYSDKIAVEHVYYKPGYYGDIQEMIMNMKKVWEQGNQSVAVYESSSSGEPQFSIVTRYKQGLKERNDDFREPFNTRFIKAHGQEGWNKWIAGRKEMLSHQWSEMLFYKPELGSK
jgi:hypothetical protein